MLGPLTMRAYGNALNVMRTVEVSWRLPELRPLTIEDVVSFRRAFRKPGRGPDLMQILRDGGRRLRDSAVAARRDPSLVIIGRTTSIHASVELKRQK